MEETTSIFFRSKYNNFYECYLPEQYLGNVLPEFEDFNSKILVTSSAHKTAIQQFMLLFPAANLEEKEAFMKSGYPLLLLRFV